MTRTQEHFTLYCKVLNNVIKGIKERHYSRLIAKSDNGTKTAWNVIKREAGKIHLAEHQILVSLEV
jgi:hypothetical protein